jgi:hypothetical protein
VHALAVDEIGEDPLRYLLLGPDRAANLLELGGAGSPEWAGGHPCDADAGQVSTIVAGRQVIEMAGKRKAGAGALDQAHIEALAAEAERGYDVEEILRRRRGGRPALGSAAASVESVRLDPELKRELLLRAARDRTSVSEVIRRALGEYLHAS